MEKRTVKTNLRKIYSAYTNAIHKNDLKTIRAIEKCVDQITGALKDRGKLPFSERIINPIITERGVVTSDVERQITTDLINNRIDLRSYCMFIEKSYLQKQNIPFIKPLL